MFPPSILSLLCSATVHPANVKTTLLLSVQYPGQEVCLVGNWGKIPVSCGEDEVPDSVSIAEPLSLKS